MESVILTVAIIILLFAIMSVAYLINKLGEFIYIVFEIKEDYDDDKQNIKVK